MTDVWASHAGSVSRSLATACVRSRPSQRRQVQLAAGAATLWASIETMLGKEIEDLSEHDQMSVHHASRRCGQSILSSVAEAAVCDRSVGMVKPSSETQPNCWYRLLKANSLSGSEKVQLYTGVQKRIWNICLRECSESDVIFSSFDLRGEVVLASCVSCSTETVYLLLLTQQSAE